MSVFQRILHNLIVTDGVQQMRKLEAGPCSQSRLCLRGGQARVTHDLGEELECRLAGGERAPSISRHLMTTTNAH